ncbi:hypothetical protein J6590_014275 [Homalodisca vitripennis]|nr:hypothetical protein J6590_014275 [Homalodisca vitripennis]
MYTLLILSLPLSKASIDSTEPLKGDNRVLSTIVSLTKVIVVVEQWDYVFTKTFSSECVGRAPTPADCSVTHGDLPLAESLRY